MRVVVRRRRAMRWLALVGVCTFAMTLGAAWFQTRLTTRQVTIDHLAKEIRAESQQYHQLRAARGRLLAPNVLSVRASAIGMAPASKTKIVQLDAATRAIVEQHAPSSPRTSVRATSNAVPALAAAGASGGTP